MQEEFMAHMKSEHKADFTDVQLEGLGPIFRRPSNEVAGTCNLCFRETEDLQGHIARHLECIATLALYTTAGLTGMEKKNETSPS